MTAAHAHENHDPADDIPQPLGTTMPCGCIVRAVFLHCDVCGSSGWLATATDAEIGEQVAVKGTCTCGAPMGHLAMVCKEPVPAALGG